ncbi:DUF4270 family protein [Hymenobacter koreensis]|uniref:DUF4270 family protein n=1 Tax=Hymenobacter koreensis TaxID=1084523 RepID=A0ABP8JG02_9BACT
MLLTSALFSLGSCEDPNELGLELPGTTSITTQYRDFPVTASTILQDSLPTLKRDLWLAGRLRDVNTEATITASSALNLIVSGDSLPSAFTGATLDSVVLYAGINKVYGISTPASFEVRRLTTRLSETAVYNANTAIPATGAPIALTGPVKLNPVSRQLVAPGSATDTTTRLVQVPLHMTLSKKVNPNPFFVNVFNELNRGGFTQQTLNGIWPGFALAPAASMQNTILGFNRTPEAEVFFYFSVTGPGRPRSLRYRLYYGDAAANGSGAAAPRYFTHIDYNRAGGRFAGLNTDADSVRSDLSNNLVYAQGGTGLAAKLTIPDLNALRGPQGLIINRAELIVPIRPLSNVQFALPNQLYLFEANKRNRILQRVVVAEPKERVVQADGQNPRGTDNPGALTVVDIGNGNRAYSMSLTAYLQAYISNQLEGELPSGFILRPTLLSAGQLSLDRAVLNASDIRLRVYYSTPKP